MEKWYKALILNRGDVAHKGAPADFQGGLRMTNNLQLDKMSIVKPVFITDIFF